MKAGVTKDVCRHTEMGQLRVCWCLTWGGTGTRWPGEQDKTGTSMVNHSEELRLSPKDKGKQGKVKAGE